VQVAARKKEEEAAASAKRAAILEAQRADELKARAIIEAEKAKKLAEQKRREQERKVRRRARVAELQRLKICDVHCEAFARSLTRRFKCCMIGLDSNNLGRPAFSRKGDTGLRAKAACA
jgi:hypothetical protein